jgi:hypothetical protein
MAETVADIVIGVTADISPLMRETSRATSEVSRFGRIADGLGKSMATLGSRATAAGVRMSAVTGAVAAMGAGMLAITRNAADMGEAVANGAKAAGMSTSAFQEYGYALSEAADMSGEDFAAATVKLNKRLGEAMAGSKSAQAAFEALGISAAEIASGTVDTDKAMAALVATLESTTDPAIAATIATELLGKSGARVGGMLAGTAGQVDELRQRAQELGIVMSEDAVEASDKFNEQWDATVKQLDAVKVAIATALMPVIVNDLIPLLQNTVIPAIVSVVNYIGEWVAAFQNMPEPIQQAIGIVAGLFVVGGPLLVAIGMTATAISALVAATGPIGLLIAAAGLLTAAWVAWGDDFKAAIGGAIDWVTEKFTAFMTMIDKIIAKLKSWKDAATEALSIGENSGLREGTGGGFNPMGDFNGGSGVDAMGGGAGTDVLAGGAGTDTLGTEPVAVTRAREINTMIENLQVQHQDTMAQIAMDAESARTSNAQSFQDSLGKIAQAGGQKSLDIFRKLVAAEATLNAGRTLLQTFADPKLGFFEKFAAVASMASAISPLVSGLGGKGARAGSGATRSVATGSAPSAPSVANITINGMMNATGFKSLTDQLNAEFKQGYVLNVVNA